MTEFHHAQVSGSERPPKASLGIPQGRLKPLPSAEWWGIRRHLDELSSLREAVRRQPATPSPTANPG
jgi:hypothetical protein